MMRIELYNGDKQEWDNFVSGMEGASIYHSIGWKLIIENTFGHSSYYLMVREANVLKGILPLFFISNRIFGSFFISLPFCTYGGIETKDETAKNILLNEAINMAREKKAEYILLRQGQNIDLPLMVNRSKVSMILPLTSSPDELWRNLKAEVRNQVRKAQKSNLTVKRGREDQLNNFYKVFSRNMRELGTPVYGRDFFMNILKEFPDNARIFSVFLNSEIIASGFTIGYKKRLEIPWASSLREHKKMCPNNLLYWEILKYGCEKKYEEFDFGRSSPDSGTFRFKKQWGAQPKQLYWYYWLPKNGEITPLNASNPKYKYAVKIWQKLPLFVTNKIGPKIVKYIP